MKKNITISDETRESLTKEAKQSPVEIKYTIIFAYSIKGISYPEFPRMACTHKLYDTIEQAISAVSTEIEEQYNNSDYYGLEIHLPKIKNGYVYDGYFTCAYKFGPKIEYTIRINEIYL